MADGIDCIYINLYRIIEYYNELTSYNGLCTELKIE